LATDQPEKNDGDETQNIVDHLNYGKGRAELLEQRTDEPEAERRVRPCEIHIRLLIERAAR
jgi:hypothetical protein